MATSEQSGGASMFSDLVGLKEHGKGGDDTEKVSSVDVSSVVREVVKESLVPLIQRVMLKIDALDGKVKQMQLAMDEMEEDGRERDGWLKKGLEEMREELAGVREGVGQKTKDEGDESESESESETGAGGLDIEELQALLNQKVEMEKKKKKKNKGVSVLCSSVDYNSSLTSTSNFHRTVNTATANMQGNQDMFARQSYAKVVFSHWGQVLMSRGAGGQR